MIDRRILKANERGSLRILLARTDGIGDLIATLPVMDRILSVFPEAEIHWLVRPYTAPLLEGLPGVAGVHLREPMTDLKALFCALKPDVVLNLFCRDEAVISAARRAGVPIRVARPRGRQMLDATHRVQWFQRSFKRHESELSMDFLSPFGLEDGWPSPPSLKVSPAELARAEAELAHVPLPRLALVVSGNAAVSPSPAWWSAAQTFFKEHGWNPIVLGPPEASPLPAADLRGLLARLACCQALVCPSTGPSHMAAALGLPVLVLMPRKKSVSRARWAPMGRRVQVAVSPRSWSRDDGGMDALEFSSLLPHLNRLK
jgi:heptosyltransferase I